MVGGGHVNAPAQALACSRHRADTAAGKSSHGPEPRYRSCHTGQRSEIKSDTFNFTRYGLYANSRCMNVSAGRHKSREPAAESSRNRRVGTQTTGKRTEGH